MRGWFTRSRLERLTGSKLVRDTGWSFLLKAFSMAAATGIAVILARVLGAEGYGIYAFAISLTTLLALPAEFGLPNLLVRETARGMALDRADLVRGVWSWGGRVAGVLSLVLVLGAGTVLLVTSDGDLSEQQATILWAFLLIPLTALGNLRGAALRGLNRIVSGQLPEFVLRPVALLALLGGALLLTGSVGPSQAMALHVVAAGIAFAAGAWLLWRYTPDPVRESSPSTETKAWLRSLFPLALLAGIGAFQRNADILLLGLFEPAAEVGQYRVAVQTATLAAFGLQAVNAVIPPRFARLHAKGDMDRLQRLVTQSARAVMGFSAAVVVLFLFAGEFVLELLFGAEFTDAYIPLLVLLGGQFVNSSVGSVGHLLTMAGYERETAKAGGFSVVLNVVLNLALIPPFGMVGAATATAVALSFRNALLWWAVRKHLGINSLAFNIGRT